MSACQRFPQYGQLHRELRGVVGVLILAPAAHREIGAAGNGALGRRIEHRIERAGHVTAMVVNNMGFDQLAGQDKRNERSFAGVLAPVLRDACQPGAAVDRFFDAQLHRGSHLLHVEQAEARKVIALQ